MPPQDNIDLSAGMVPLSGQSSSIDLSAGMVPISNAATPPPLSKMTPQQAMEMNRQTSQQALSNTLSQQFGVRDSSLPQPQVGRSSDMANDISNETFMGALKKVARQNDFQKVEQVAGDQRRFFQKLGDQGVISPNTVAAGTYPASVLETMGRYGAGMTEPKNLALTGAAMIPALRPVVGAYLVGTGGKQLYDTNTSKLPFLSPDRVEGNLLGLSGVVGGATAASEGVQGAYRAATKVTPEASQASLRAMSGQDVSPEMFHHIRGVASDMGYTDADFAKGKPDAHLKADLVYQEASRRLANQYNGLVQPLAGNSSPMPSLAPELRGKIAAQFANAGERQLANRILTGDTTVGDLESLRSRLNGMYKDQVYSAPEQAALKEFGTRLRDQLYNNIAASGVDPAALTQLKSLQGEMISAEKGFTGGTKTAGTVNNTMKAGNRVQNVMRSSPAQKFKTGLTGGVSKILTGDADKAALLQNTFKNLNESQQFQMPGTNVPPIQQWMPGRPGGGATPNNPTQPFTTQPPNAGALPRGPLQMPQAQMQSVPSQPFVDATTRAQRFGRLLPAQAGGPTAFPPETIQGGGTPIPSGASTSRVLPANVPSSVEPGPMQVVRAASRTVPVENGMANMKQYLTSPARPTVPENQPAANYISSEPTGTPVQATALKQTVTKPKFTYENHQSETPTYSDDPNAFKLYSQNPELFRTHTMEIHDSNGNKIADVKFTRVGDKITDFDVGDKQPDGTFVHDEKLKNRIGTRGSLDLRRQLESMFPDVNEISGRRITGWSPNRDLTLPINRRVGGTAADQIAQAKMKILQDVGLKAEKVGDEIRVQEEEKGQKNK